jgi:hypothetical protein
LLRLKDSRDGKTFKISELEVRITKMEAELEACRSKNLKVHAAPSLIPSQEPAGLIARDVAPSGGRKGKLYSEAMDGEKREKIQADPNF